MVAAVPAVLLCVFAFAGLPTGFSSFSSKPREAMPSAGSAPQQRQTVKLIGKSEVQRLIAGKNLMNSMDSQVEIQRGNTCFTLQTSLDPGLQQVLMQRLDRKNSRYIGIVAMDPADGRILAMAGHDKTDASANPCLDSRFPAASIFKIITAAAAVETRELEPGSILNFNGGKYTLYRSQIQSQRMRQTNTITLKDSFAQSVNPVFGKLGAHALGRSVIEAYAEAFGFNREIDFDLPIRPSRIELTDGAFELAEVASGYNRTTRISPLHGAMMAAAIANQGRLAAPSVVDWVANDSGQTIYQRQAASPASVIDIHTAQILRQLMQATVQSGTARKEFHKHSDDRILAHLEIGGKTGSMGDGTAETRYDWFVGYASDPLGSRQLVFSVMVAHEDYIGTRAAAYAAMAIKEYFRGHMAGLKGANRSLPPS